MLGKKMTIRTRFFRYQTKDGGIRIYAYLYGYWREGKKVKCKYLGRTEPGQPDKWGEGLKLGKFRISHLAEIWGIKDWFRKRYWLGQAVNKHFTVRQLEAIRFLENDGDLLGDEKAQVLEKIRKGLNGKQLKQTMDLYRLKRILTPP